MVSKTVSEVKQTREDRPSLAYERRLWADGYCCIAGLDEAGRGAWAGPVVAAAVVLPQDEPELQQHLDGVRDSKQLSPLRREDLLQSIIQHAAAHAVGCIPSDLIDALGIVPATRQAMSLAVGSLSSPADYLLVDYLRLPGQPLPQYSLAKGDARILSIAAASIVAKVYRDQVMVGLDDQYPGYGFARHKGYGTPQHRAALDALGPCPVHRFSFAPVRYLAGSE